MRIILGCVVLCVVACSKPPDPHVLPDPAPPERPTKAPGVPSSALALEPAALATLGPAVEAYLTIQAKLAGDATEGVASAAAAVADAAAKARSETRDDQVLRWLTDIEAHARHLARETELKVARRVFGELSRPIVALVSAVPELQKGRHVFLCPMADGYQKWLQETPELKNPYFGTQMLHCGEKSSWAE